MTYVEKHPAFQSLMDQAYDRYQAAERMSSDEFIAQLTGRR